MPAIEATPTGCRILLHVVPRASRTAVAGLHDGRVKLAVAAPPVDGEANDAGLKRGAEADERRRWNVRAGEQPVRDERSQPRVRLPAHRKSLWRFRESRKSQVAPEQFVV